MGRFAIDPVHRGFWCMRAYVRGGTEANRYRRNSIAHSRDWTVDRGLVRLPFSSFEKLVTSPRRVSLGCIVGCTPERPRILPGGCIGNNKRAVPRRASRACSFLLSFRLHPPVVQRQTPCHAPRLFLLILLCQCFFVHGIQTRINTLPPECINAISGSDIPRAYKDYPSLEISFMFMMAG